MRHLQWLEYGERKSKAEVKIILRDNTLDYILFTSWGLANDEAGQLIISAEIRGDAIPNLWILR